MAAGMHAHGFAVDDVLQRVHVGPQRHDRSRLGSLEDRHHAGAADAGGHTESRRLDPFRQPGRGAMFGEPDLRDRV